MDRVCFWTSTQRAQPLGFADHWVGERRLGLCRMNYAEMFKMDWFQKNQWIGVWDYEEPLLLEI